MREDHLRREVKERNLSNVTFFVPPQPFERMSSILALGHVQIVSLKDVPLYRSTLPSKLQANMAAGRPILGALAGDAADVVEASGAGRVCVPGDAVGMAQAVRELADLKVDGLDRLGHMARAHYELEFSERAVSDRLDQLLRETVAEVRG